MVARAEIDMLDIKAEFLKMYGKTLHSFIKVGHWGHLTKHNLQKPLTKYYNYFKIIHLFSRGTHRAITARSCWSCAEGKSNTSNMFISVKRSLSHQPSAFQIHSLFVILIKTKQSCFKWDSWFFLFIALGFMGVLYRLAHLRVWHINKRRKKQPTFYWSFVVSLDIFLISAHSLRSICLITLSTICLMYNINVYPAQLY